MFMAQEMVDKDYVAVETFKDALRRATNSARKPDGIRYEDNNKWSDKELEELASMYYNSIKDGVVNAEWFIII